MTINVSMIEAVALAVLTYALGLQIKKRLTILQKLSLPASVIGGMLFAAIVSILEACGLVHVKFDSTLQTLLMLAFFTTIGLSASLSLVINGGKLLLLFLIASSILGVFQNALGMWVAEAMGIDFHYGLLAGGVSLMGGLGTSAAFGPYFEQTYGITGGTVMAITAATFGMAVALMIGGPFGEWLIRRYKVVTPISVKQPSKPLHIPDDWKLPLWMITPQASPPYRTNL
jgi:ESS family glutamate:Na+ symporter